MDENKYFQKKLPIPRFVNESDSEKLEKFYLEAYGKDHILNNLIHHDWQFKNNPFNNWEGKSIIIVEDKNEIISHMGLIPVPVKIFNNVVSGVWHCSYFTLEKYRGIGCGTKIVQFSTSLYNCMMGLGNSEASNKIHIKNGSKDYGNVNRFIKIMEQEKIEKFIDKKLSIPQNHINKKNNAKLRRITILDQKYDCFWERVKVRFPITINRTKEYLSWRFLNHPLIQYHFLILESNNEIVGYSVLRYEDKNDDLKAARIVDLIVLEEFEEELIQKTVDYCNNKVDFIDFFCTGSFYKNTFKILNFINDSEGINKIPRVFNPINSNVTTINLHFKYNDFSPDDSKYYKYDNLFFVKADSDADRAF